MCVGGDRCRVPAKNETVRARLQSHSIDDGRTVKGGDPVIGRNGGALPG
jgi:hypothetical protein